MDLIVDYIDTGKVSDINALLEELLEIQNDKLCAIAIRQSVKEISAKNIPQYSSFADGTINLTEYLRHTGDFGPTFCEIGRHFSGSDSNTVAIRKYGENHAKLASLLGLVYIDGSRPSRVYLTELGKAFEKYNNDQKIILAYKLAINIPIVVWSIKNNVDNQEELLSVLENYLSSTTALRRKRNTWDLIVHLKCGV